MKTNLVVKLHEHCLFSICLTDKFYLVATEQMRFIVRKKVRNRDRKGKRLRCPALNILSAEKQTFQVKGLVSQVLFDHKLSCVFSVLTSIMYIFLPYYLSINRIFLISGVRV